MPSSPATPLAAEPSIAARIAAALPSLTPIHRRMGEYVLANPFRAATMRIDELANAVDASIATANRFARALGFDGYPALRAALVRGFEATLAPVERLRCAQEREAGARGGDSLLAARRIFIVGMGASAFLAGLMEHGLSVYRDNVQSLALLGGPTDAARRLFSARGDDLVVAIAFPRYVYDTIELTRRAAERGAPVLAITDGPDSPIAPFAARALFVHAERRLAATSEAAVLALVEALIDAVAHRSQRSARAAAEVTEFMLPWLEARGACAAPPRPPRRSRKTDR
ncbi:MurR/RpiR family transcriptional regulator [Burkholderia pseudomallei]|uniref:MurR/RpiR family transcriptional regulator n=1 Tax=Burkholderia pseudomallei TaxID=28450 RepID=UPI001604AEAC|nr:MurR/RpiR family transcriptional regulator [Burkholderia pseudomallei]